MTISAANPLAERSHLPFQLPDFAALTADAPDAPFQAPPPYAIAHTLLRYWVEL